MDVTGHTRSRRPQHGDGTRRRPVSIRDVAKAAGVSHQTVSRVINDSPSVRPATRERVLAAIDELGFRRSAAALALASGQTRAVTVLTANTTLHGFATTLQGIEEASRAAGFSLAISVLDAGDEDAISTTVTQAADDSNALIIIAYDSTGVRALSAIPDGVPHVAATETPARAATAPRHWMWTDDRAAAAEATRHLLGLGHRTVHYVAIPSMTDISQRAVGWRSALADAGAPIPEPLQGGWDIGSGYRAGQLLARDPAVTAVLCGNDDLALGVVRAMHEANRGIPDSVSVMGFDDAPQSAYLTPTLSTVRLDFTGLGRACFALLRDQLTPGIQIPPVTAPQLVLRESTGPAPSVT